MSTLGNIRLALRLLRRTRLPSAVALLSIALTVGAAAVVFAAIKSVLIDPMPYARPSELVLFRSDFPTVQQQSHGDWVIWNDVQELGCRMRTVSSIGAFGNAIFDLAGGKVPPEALYGVRVNADLLRVLGVSPMLGRNILPDEDRPGHPDVIILSYGLWARRFHSDRSIVGRTLSINGHGCMVIGVMPPAFNFPMRRDAARLPSPYVDFWAAPFVPSPNPDAGLGAVARLRRGVTLARARQEIASVSRDLTREFPATNRERVLAVNSLRDRTIGAAGRRLWLMMAAAVLFMLIGCANVANLLLARGLSRRREVAVRLAIGARHVDIVRQFLTESCVLAVLGGLGAYLVAAAAWKVLPALAPASVPRLAGARADSAVFGFALALAVVNGILFGMAPAIRLAPWNRAALWSGSGSRGIASGRDPLRSTLVAAEVALSVLLVVIGAQVLAGFARLLAADPGFQADRVLASVVLPARERYPDPEQRALFYRRILGALRALPGVDSAGTVDALPFSGENHGGFVSAGSPPSPRIVAEIDVAGGDYLQTMGVRLLAGRWFREEEMSPSGDAAIVNSYVAQQLWPGISALGQRVCVYCTPENPRNWKQVVGVVSSAAHAALDEPRKGDVYLAAGAMQQSVFLVVRTGRPVNEMEQAIRRAIASIDPNQPVFLSASMRDLIEYSIADRRFIMTLLAVTAALALLMSAAGVYGVISYTTSRRTQEIGIRLALGATRANVLALIFRQSFLTVVIGLAAGLAAALVSGRLLRDALLGLNSGYTAAIPIAAALVTITAALACWIPARRAARIEPISALREE